MCPASKNASRDFCQSSAHLHSRTGGVITGLELNTALHLPARIFCQIHQKPTRTPGRHYSPQLIMNPLGLRDELMVYTFMDIDCLQDIS